MDLVIVGVQLTEFLPMDLLVGLVRAPAAFYSSSFSAPEAGAVVSPTISSTGTVSYQTLVGHPIDSGVASPTSTELARGPPPGFSQVFAQDLLVGSISVHHLLRSQLQARLP